MKGEQRQWTNCCPLMLTVKMKTKASKKKKAFLVVGIVVAFLLIQWLFIGWKYNFGPFKILGRLRLSKMEGNSEKYDFSHLQPRSDSPLKGKNVLFLGSSVTNGAAALHQSIPEYVSVRLGCNSTKEAVDGTTLVHNGKNSYIQRMKNKVAADAQIDLLICQLSTNDASKKMPLGEISEGMALEGFDTGTITGAMEYIICYAKQTWDCPVVFYTNARFESEHYAAMVNRLYALKEKWGIGILDLWSGDEFNDITEEQRELYMKDSIHPYKAGYRDWWGPELERQLCGFFGTEE